MMSRVIPASAKKPFAMPIYQGQPTALAEPIIPVEMVSTALADGAARASAQQNAPTNCVSRDEAMADPSRIFIRASCVAACAVTLPVSLACDNAAERPNRSRRRRTARHQKVAGEHLHHFLVLIERRVLHADHAAIGL